ncbi:unnamed protein product [Discosporangium mesarthrocarpum]
MENDAPVFFNVLLWVLSRRTWNVLLLFVIGFSVSVVIVLLFVIGFLLVWLSWWISVYLSCDGCLSVDLVVGIYLLTSYYLLPECVLVWLIVMGTGTENPAACCWGFECVVERIKPWCLLQNPWHSFYCSLWLL